MRRSHVLVAGFIGFVLFSGARATAQNLALNKPATGTASCNASESPAKAVNGTVNGGIADKFCSSVAPGWLQVDLGTAQSIGSFTVRHAGAGGESASFDTRDFNIQLSTNGTTWTTAVTVTGNTANVTTHPIATQAARYVRLNITAATQTTDATARIYELEVYAAGAAQAPFGGANASLANGAVIQAENYDLGGQGIAYNDTTAGNAGAQYRSDNVDLEACTDAGGGYNAGWLVDGEWLEYTVNATAGTYTITARVASAGAAVGDLRILLDGVVLGTMAVNATGGWQSYTDVSLNGIAIAAGANRVLRLEVVNGGDFNLNHLRFMSTGPTPTSTARPTVTATATSTATPTATPSGQGPFGGTNGSIANGGVIQAESYDLGGQGVAYNDTTAGNTGGQYRADNVDLEACTDAGGGYDVGWIVDGEWLEYTVNATAGTYSITARVASAGAAVGDLRVLLDGVVLGTIPVVATGGWQTYVDATLSGIPIAGGNNRVLRLEAVNGGDFNVNYVRFSTGASPTATATSTPVAGSGDVVGKVTVGYQAWFAAIGDGSPINAWWHWSQNWSQTPSVAQNVIHAWPDTREYSNLYATAYSNLGNGQPARLFSSFDQSTINTQMSWMKQYGVDTAALQRFNPTGGEGPVRDAITAKVRSAAEAVGVKFYVMYDVSGWTNMQSEIKNDWLNKMSVYAASPAYARQNGKPVVAIWGFGFNDGNHPWDAATCLDVVNWFKGQGVYVIGGVPREWRTGTGGSRAGFLGVYHAFNMISPWLVGAIGNVTDADNLYNNTQIQDQADLNANGIAYQPCVLPGDNGQRAHGDFMWRQFYNVVRLGAQGIYISMFDEYNEGNQIAKTAEDSSMSPTGTSAIFFTLDQDGTRCSSDYYLRLTGDGGRMLKKQIGLTATRPTSPQ